MANQDQLDERKAILRARGVPEAFIANLAARRDRSLSYMLMVNVLPGVVLVAVTYGMVPHINDAIAWLIPHLYGHLGPHLLFQPGVGLLFAVLIGIAALALTIMFTLIGSWVGRAGPFPAYSFRACALRDLGRGETAASVTPVALTPELLGAADDTVFLNILDAKSKRSRRLIFGVPIGLLWLAFLVTAISGSNSYTVVTNDAVKIHTLFHTQTYALKDAQSAQVSCANEPKYAVFQYRLVFDGKPINMPYGPYSDITRAQALERLVQLDDHLKALHVPIDRVPSYDPALFMSRWLAESPGADPALLNRLVLGH